MKLLYSKKIFPFIVQMLFLLPPFYISCQAQTTPEQPPFHFTDSVYIQIDSTENLYLFLPKYRDIELVCGTRPDTLDTNIVLCVPAAFTGKILDTFYHENIAGNHVSKGKFYNGYLCDKNFVGFVYYRNGRKQILPSGQYNALIQSDSNIVAAYEQAALIVSDTIFYPTLYKNLEKREVYRALCEMQDGDFYIVMSKKKHTFGSFLQSLKNEIHAKNAIYMDMGPGWNHSWYLGDDKKHHLIFPYSRFSQYQTNWLIFKL
mgnify:FL=1